ncbi:MAG TPA: ABC transporter permease [Chryseosolibacter sp.]
MFINYLKIALRYLLKNRTFSAINIFGLTLGFLCFILITLYIHDELNFDLFHKDASRISRVIQDEQLEDGTRRNVAPVAGKIATEAVKQIPEVEDAVRISALGRITMGNDPINRDYEVTLTTDENFFRFFDFPLLEGDANTALKTPDAIVISERYAEKYFGKENPMGKRLWSSLERNEQPVEFVVTGVMKNFPKNSHLQIDILFSETSWPTIFPNYTSFVNSDWQSNTFITYLKTKPGVNEKNIEAKITQLVKNNYSGENNFNSKFTLQPLKDIHLYSEGIQGNEVFAANIKPFYLYMFGAVGALILLIACLNYMNLSTAAAYKRTKEIGTRKTLGALKSQLIGQFSGEAIVLSTVSLLLAITLLQVFLPFINTFLDKELAIQNLSIEGIGLVIAVVIIAGILSSLYPAFIITRVMPSEALKKDVKLGSRSLPVRKILVVAQFAISIVMIASTLIIYKQLQYLRNKDLGFKLNNLLVIDINSARLRRDFETIKAEFGKVPEVQSITTSTRVPGEWKTFPITTINEAGSSSSVETIFVGIDKDFLSTYSIKLLEGRNFGDSRSDSTKVILTKLAVKQLGLTNPVGQIIEIPKMRWGGTIQNLESVFRVEVIGVVDDFHFESFRKEMMPLIFGAANTVIQRIDYYTLRIQTNDWDKTIARLKEVNTSIDQNNPMEYTFLDKSFERFYNADEKRGQVFVAFSAIIVLIACLGLFALVSYSIESRMKEIGVRKVLGASVESIVTLISKEFLALVLIAGVIGIPLSYYMMERWLQDFAYHIPMGIGIFALAALIAVLIAFITISVRSVRAATSNPVNSLRNE